MLESLLAYLAVERITAPATWREWTIAPMSGGANNLLYRVRRDGNDLVVKFTMRDERDRAGREFAALTALRQAGLDVAPLPVLLDRQSYDLPVVVQTYVQGEASAVPPAGDEEWQRLIEHMLAVHSVMPDTVNVALPEAVAGARTAAEARARLGQQVARLRAEARPAELAGLMRRLDATSPPVWPPVAPVLRRGDPNIANFIRRPGPWASVDWEYAGWGDAAFDVADLVTHPAYIDVPGDLWPTFVRQYAAASPDGGCAGRVWAYAGVLAVFWVARLARQRRETRLGLDRRLVDTPPEWESEWQRKHDHYVRLADELLR